jgi:RNA polymerase sigma-70 factor (ECF subfamily)
VSSSSAVPPEGPDEILLARAARGERDALDRVLRGEQQRIYAICVRMTGNEADARDAAQEAMLAICRGLPGFDRRSAFRTWVYRVTTNACLDELRRRSRRPVAFDPTIAPAAAPAERAPDDAVTARLTLDAALARLPLEYRAVLVLRELCALDYAEIGDVLALPPGTVRSRLSRARAALLHALGNPAPLDDRPTSTP